ncbi:vesicle-associated membrane protein/synaptobrevin-binding protein isoform X1 [Danaus plexippus]|uniref:VAMP-associated protein n=1 Tax=Danaus plexippus plexippus TaxID=278856 RepID=A0A212EGN0_DANPL|nr:vesicle-associated membrane protein/synaptobrevin-binding protein isoform X1 [Danaus plexippus]OWR40634.1 putative VAMP-associated protein [Danaus plexippus plexippus]
MPNQVLIIEPQNELKFKIDYSGFFDMGCTTYMKLTNPTDHTVLFKIKTTAPKKYCVRPNSGFLDPKSKVDIAITPQPVNVESNEKNKHKFMVQSVIAPEGKINIDQVWKEINPKQLMDYKLKCVFETPQVKSANDSGDNAAANEVTKKRVAVADESKPAVKDSDGVQSESNRRDPDAAVNQSTDVLQKSENLESDLQKATNEVIHLREEESILRHENLRLKEELLRLHQGGAGEGRPARGHSYGPEKTEHAALMAWVATAIAMALLGIIIGKFIM